MNRQQIVKQWLESTQDAIAALAEWQNALTEWVKNGGNEQYPGDFVAFMRLYQAGLGDGWADAIQGDIPPKVAEIVAGARWRIAKES